MQKLTFPATSGCALSADNALKTTPPEQAVPMQTSHPNNSGDKFRTCRVQVREDGFFSEVTD